MLAHAAVTNISRMWERLGDSLVSSAIIYLYSDLLDLLSDPAAELKVAVTVSLALIS